MNAEERREWWRQAVEIDSEAELMWCLQCYLVARVDDCRVEIDPGDGFEYRACSDPKCDGAGPGMELFPWEPDEQLFVPFVAGVVAGEYVDHFDPRAPI
jgi:hypothetical protein